MHFRAKDYAEALREVMRSLPPQGRRGLLDRFLAVVRKHGGLSRIQEIVRAVEALEVRGRGGRWIELEFARPMGERVLGRFRARIAGRDRMSVAVNPALVAGVRVTVDGETELDHSLERKLKKLFPKENRQP